MCVHGTPETTPAAKTDKKVDTRTTGAPSGSGRLDTARPTAPRAEPVPTTRTTCPGGLAGGRVRPPHGRRGGATSSQGWDREGTQRGVGGGDATAGAPWQWGGRAGGTGRGRRGVTTVGTSRQGPRDSQWGGRVASRTFRFEPQATQGGGSLQGLRSADGRCAVRRGIFRDPNTRPEPRQTDEGPREGTPVTPWACGTIVGRGLGSRHGPATIPELG